MKIYFRMAAAITMSPAAVLTRVLTRASITEAGSGTELGRDSGMTTGDIMTTGEGTIVMALPETEGTILI
ncbi:hypothetical protein FACS1894167_05580 [Synergistales bacterium]|nr:hypothetical protein FACS1894167_05580 [Synergistales bacterium]